MMRSNSIAPNILARDYRVRTVLHRLSVTKSLCLQSTLFGLVFIASLFVVDAVQGQTAIAEAPVKKQANKDKANANHAANDDSSVGEERYVRVSHTKKDDAKAKGKPKALQTAIVRYTGRKGTSYEGRVVDLVGVVHIGQKGYYKKLNDKLATYETVLYELVAPDGTRIKPEDLEKRRSVLASMQTGMKDMLNLEYQLERIDYMAENFRHADMSPEEFSDDLKRRGDSLWKMGARMMGAGIASQAKTGGDSGLLLAFFSKDRAKRMKQMMARQLVDIETVTAGMDDAEGNNTLIKGRNAKAFQVLRDELDKGKKNVAVFYGAGHLPDMAERLENEFFMEVGDTTWLDAWDLTRN